MCACWVEAAGAWGTSRKLMYRGAVGSPVTEPSARGLTVHPRAAALGFAVGDAGSVGVGVGDGAAAPPHADATTPATKTSEERRAIPCMVPPWCARNITPAPKPKRCALV